MKIHKYVKKVKLHKLFKRSAATYWALAFACIGIAALLVSNAAPPTGTWVNITPPPPASFNYVAFQNYGAQTIVVAPSNPNVVYLGSCLQGIFKTTNKGVSWTKVNTGTKSNELDAGRNWSMAVDPTNENVLYTMSGYSYPGLYKSIDGGVNWQQMIPDSISQQILNPWGAQSNPYSIAINPSNHNHLLVTFHANWGSNSSGLIESLDGGTTWKIHQAGAGSWGSGHYVFFVTPTIWMVGTQDNGMWRTTNQGTSWSKVSDNNIQHGAAQQYRASDGRLYMSSSNGIIRSSDDGATWTNIGPGGSYGAIIGDGTNLYAIPTWTSNATWYVSDESSGGTNWTQFNSQTFNNGTMSMAFDPVNRIIYASNWEAGVWKLQVGASVPVTDTTAPTVTISEPANNASVVTGTSVTFSATASDNVGVSRVDFYVNTTLVTSDTTSPYSTSINTTQFGAGTQTLRAQAFDTANNNTQSSTRNLIITSPPSDTTPPVVSITAPTNGAILSGNNSTIQASASDASGVTKVDFYLDNALIGTDNLTPFTFGLNTTFYSNAAHTLRAVATDGAGLSANSANVNVTINNVPADTNPPSIVVTAPLINAVISGSYQIGANVSDASGVARVEFSVDAGSVLSTDTQSPYSYTLNTFLLSNGSHSIKVTAFDTIGNTRTVTVPVTVDNTVIQPVQIQGDANDDKHVDLKDLIILLQNYGKQNQTFSTGDFNTDGFVDIKDLILLLGNYGKV